MVRRGEIYRADLYGARGREQKGRRRPVLIVSADEVNARPLVVTVVVGTTARGRLRHYVTNVFAAAEETGLPNDTVFLCFQIRGVDVSRFEVDKAGAPAPAGVMPPARMAEVDAALRLVLDL